jgi:eukaryotic-like serine/threonine-protein kinase
MLHPGVRLGDRYRLEARLGAGGMGEVWRAVDEVLGRTVAVKAMLPSVADDPDFARRFLAEATAMAQVNHPAVASIHDYGRSRDITYLVMEFIDGESLAQVLARGGRLGTAETMWLVAQAADGLQAVHDRGIVHRDIKPANLMIRRDGSLLITDFGISRTDDASRLTASGAILGTPTYLSPEQVLGQPATARSDVYSLGLTAYECLAGHRPFAGDNPYAIALQRLQAAPRTIGVALPGPVLGVVERALATDPGRRWPSAAALAEAARAAVPASGASGEARPATGPAPPAAGPASLKAGPVAPASAGSASPVAARRPGPSRRRAVLIGLVALLLIGGVTAGTLAGRDRGGSGAEPVAAPSGASPGAAVPAGFTACGTAICPAEPLCWGGLTSISGKAMPPERIDCTQDHVWETFAAVPLAAAEATTVRPEALMARADVAAACSSSAMASRSSDPDATRPWVRDAWPIELPGSGGWLVHCMARPEPGESSRSAF